MFSTENGVSDEHRRVKYLQSPLLPCGSQAVEDVRTP
jgi:hypothetical protein